MHLVLFKLNYLDPGSGSILVQLIAAGLLGGVGILVKTFWGRIRAFFKGEKYQVPQSTVDEEKTEE
jgi:hypothetical protein